MKSQTEALVCDVDGSDEEVTSYTIVSPEGAAVVDLCPKDAKPLLKLWKLGSTEPRKKITGNKRPEGHAVIPVD